MSPRIIDKKERQKEIALVALDLFAEKGFEATSISNVAKAAGIGKGTVYEYFSSKEELIAEAFMVWIDQMMGQDVDELLANIEDPEQRLRVFVQAMMEAFIHDERSVKMTISTFQMMLQSGLESAHHHQFRRVFYTMWELLDAVLLDGVKQGSFRPEITREVRTVSVNMMAYLDGIAFHYMVNKDEIDVMAQVNFYLDRLIHYLKIPK